MESTFNDPMFETSRASFLAGLMQQVRDPRVRLALTCCQDQILEPPLGLSQIQEALAQFRPSGKAPCCRTVQRWVVERGMPCSTDGTNDRRIYFLSQVLAWWQETFRSKSIAQDAVDCARKQLINKSAQRRASDTKASLGKCS